MSTELPIRHMPALGAAGFEPRIHQRLISCPSCRRVLAAGEYVYGCEVCGKECCTACTDTTDQHAVVCDDCNPSP